MLIPGVRLVGAVEWGVVVAFDWRLVEDGVRGISGLLCFINERVRGACLEELAGGAPKCLDAVKLMERGVRPPEAPATGLLVAGEEVDVASVFRPAAVDAFTPNRNLDETSERGVTGADFCAADLPTTDETRECTGPVVDEWPDTWNDCVDPRAAERAESGARMDVRRTQLPTEGSSSLSADWR